MYGCVPEEHEVGASKGTTTDGEQGDVESKRFDARLESNILRRLPGNSGVTNQPSPPPTSHSTLDNRAESGAGKVLKRKLDKLVFPELLLVISSVVLKDFEDVI